MLIKLVMFQTKDSTNGFMFSFGSGVVSWNNKKQPIVALLSTKVK